MCGCLPADAAYFTVYEIMKMQFGFNNDRFDLVNTAAIGAAATIVHDLFITPTDSK